MPGQQENVKHEQNLWDKCGREREQSRILRVKSKKILLQSLKKYFHRNSKVEIKRFTIKPKYLEVFLSTMISVSPRSLSPEFEWIVATFQFQTNIYYHYLHSWLVSRTWRILKRTKFYLKISTESWEKSCYLTRLLPQRIRSNWLIYNKHFRNFIKTLQKPA